jgi:outer membrane protein assembly factor BamB
VTLRLPLRRSWTRLLGGDVSYPLTDGDRVFVTAANADLYGSTLYALSLANGHTLWSRALEGSAGWSGLAYDQGRVFTVTNDGTFSAFDPATGSVVWSVQLPGQYDFTSPPSAAGGIIYDDGSGADGTMYAISEQSGQLLWDRLVRYGQHSSPALDATHVYVTFPSWYYAFDSFNGTQTWLDTFCPFCGGGGGRTPVVADAHVYVRDPSEADALRAPGVIVSAATGVAQGPLESLSAPAVAGGLAYEMTGSTPAGGRNLEAIWRDGLGTRAWSFRGDGNLDTAPIVLGNRVWVGSYSGRIYALDRRRGPRARIWTASVGHPIDAPDEQNVSQPLTGLGASPNSLLVPAGPFLVMYRSR